MWWNMDLPGKNHRPGKYKNKNDRFPDNSFSVLLQYRAVRKELVQKHRESVKYVTNRCVGGGEIVEFSRIKLDSQQQQNERQQLQQRDTSVVPRCSGDHDNLQRNKNGTNNNNDQKRSPWRRDVSLEGSDGYIDDDFVFSPLLTPPNADNPKNKKRQNVGGDIFFDTSDERSHTSSCQSDGQTESSSGFDKFHDLPPPPSAVKPKHRGVTLQSQPDLSSHVDSLCKAVLDSNKKSRHVSFGEDILHGVVELKTKESKPESLDTTHDDAPTDTHSTISTDATPTVENKERSSAFENLTISDGIKSLNTTGPPADSQSQDSDDAPFDEDSIGPLPDECYERIVDALAPVDSDLHSLDAEKKGLDAAVVDDRRETPTETKENTIDIQVTAASSGATDESLQDVNGPSSSPKMLPPILAVTHPTTFMRNKLSPSSMRRKDAEVSTDIALDESTVGEVVTDSSEDVLSRIREVRKEFMQKHRESIKSFREQNWVAESEISDQSCGTTSPSVGKDIQLKVDCECRMQDASVQTMEDYMDADFIHSPLLGPKENTFNLKEYDDEEETTNETFSMNDYEEEFFDAGSMNLHIETNEMSSRASSDDEFHDAMDSVELSLGNSSLEEVKDIINDEHEESTPVRKDISVSVAENSFELDELDCTAETPVASTIRRKPFESCNSSQSTRTEEEGNASTQVDGSSSDADNNSFGSWFAMKKSNVTKKLSDLSKVNAKDVQCLKDSQEPTWSCSFETVSTDPVASGRPGVGLNVTLATTATSDDGPYGTSSSVFSFDRTLSTRSDEPSVDDYEFASMSLSSSCPSNNEVVNPTPTVSDRSRLQAELESQSSNEAMGVLSDLRADVKNDPEPVGNLPESQDSKAPMISSEIVHVDKVSDYNVCREESGEILSSDKSEDYKMQVIEPLASRKDECTSDEQSAPRSVESDTDEPHRESHDYAQEDNGKHSTEMMMTVVIGEREEESTGVEVYATCKPTSTEVVSTTNDGLDTAPQTCTVDSVLPTPTSTLESSDSRHDLEVRKEMQEVIPFPLHGRTDDAEMYSDAVQTSSADNVSDFEKHIIETDFMDDEGSVDVIQNQEEMERTASTSETNINTGSAYLDSYESSLSAQTTNVGDTSSGEAHSKEDEEEVVEAQSLKDEKVVTSSSVTISDDQADSSLNEPSSSLETSNVELTPDYEEERRNEINEEVDEEAVDGLQNQEEEKVTKTPMTVMLACAEPDFTESLEGLQTCDVVSRSNEINAEVDEETIDGLQNQEVEKVANTPMTVISACAEPDFTESLEGLQTCEDVSISFEKVTVDEIFEPKDNEKASDDAQTIDEEETFNSPTVTCSDDAKLDSKSCLASQTGTVESVSDSELGNAGDRPSKGADESADGDQSNGNEEETASVNNPVGGSPNKTTPKSLECCSALHASKVDTCSAHEKPKANEKDDDPSLPCSSETALSPTPAGARDQLGLEHTSFSTVVNDVQKGTFDGSCTTPTNSSFDPITSAWLDELPDRKEASPPAAVLNSPPKTKVSRTDRVGKKSVTPGKSPVPFDERVEEICTPKHSEGPVVVIPPPPTPSLSLKGSQDAEVRQSPWLRLIEANKDKVAAHEPPTSIERNKQGRGSPPSPEKPSDYSGEKTGCFIAPTGKPNKALVIKKDKQTRQSTWLRLIEAHHSLKRDSAQPTRSVASSTKSLQQPAGEVKHSSVPPPMAALVASMEGISGLPDSTRMSDPRSQEKNGETNLEIGSGDENDALLSCLRPPVVKQDSTASSLSGKSSITSTPTASVELESYEKTCVAGKKDDNNWGRARSPIEHESPVSSLGSISPCPKDAEDPFSSSSPVQEDGNNCSTICQPSTTTLPSPERDGSIGPRASDPSSSKTPQSPQQENRSSYTVGDATPSQAPQSPQQDKKLKHTPIDAMSSADVSKDETKRWARLRSPFFQTMNTVANRSADKPSEGATRLADSSAHSLMMEIRAKQFATRRATTPPRGSVKELPTGDAVKSPSHSLVFADMAPSLETDIRAQLYVPKKQSTPHIVESAAWSTCEEEKSPARKIYPDRAPSLATESRATLRTPPRSNKNSSPTAVEGSINLTPLSHRQQEMFQKLHHLPVCKNQFTSQLHSNLGPCDRCWSLATARERAIYMERGSHFRIMRTRSGCDRTCKIFTPKGNEEAARLCRKCFFDTHQKPSEKVQVYRGNHVKMRPKVY